MVGFRGFRVVGHQTLMTNREIVTPKWWFPLPFLGWTGLKGCRRTPASEHRPAEHQGGQRGTNFRQPWGTQVSGCLFFPMVHDYWKHRNPGGLVGVPLKNGHARAKSALLTPLFSELHPFTHMYIIYFFIFDLLRVCPLSKSGPGGIQKTQKMTNVCLKIVYTPPKRKKSEQNSPNHA